MFCKKCGAQLKENAKFCGACGAPVQVEETPVQTQQSVVEQQQIPADPFAQAQPVVNNQPPVDAFATIPSAAPVQTQQPQYQTQPQQTHWGTMQPKAAKSGGKGLLIGLISGGAALLVAIIVIVICLFACGGSGASSPQEAVEAYFEALNDKDFDALKDIIYPAMMEEVYDDELYDEEEFMERFAYKSSPADDKDAKVKFSNPTIDNIDNVSASTIKSANKALKEEYDSYIEIEKMVTADGVVTIKVDDDKHDYEYDVKLVKADGDWYIFSMKVTTYGYVK